MAAAARQGRKQALDACLRQHLSPNFTEAAANANTHMELVRRSSCAMAGDVMSFARFLHRNRCLEIVLFWKEVEAYRTLFSGRSRAAARISRQYLEEGGTWQVSFSSLSTQSRIADSMGESVKQGDEPAEELFDEAQLEVYNLMRLDLFPRFVKEMESGLTRPSTPAEGVAESIGVVLAGTNAAASISFHQFARENYCEEALLFWLEANAFTLLLDGRDLKSRAGFIFQTFMRESAIHEINVSNALRALIRDRIDRDDINNEIFAGAQKEAERELEYDVFPRYTAWAKERLGPGGEVTPTRGKGRNRVAPAPLRASASAAGAGTSGDSRERAREHVRELFVRTDEMARLRVIASELHASENLEFWKDVQHYKLLFAPRDRQRMAVELWERYVDEDAVHIITLPDEAKCALKTEVLGGGEVTPTAFDWAERETVFLIADNLYPIYQKRFAPPLAQVAMRGRTPSGTRGQGDIAEEATAAGCSKVGC